MEMLELNNLHKTFNPGTVNEKVALNGVSLHMEAGDFATIVGSNGAGKSTMFNAITGGFIADEGSIVLGGQDITFAPEYERSKVIGHLFQDPLKGTLKRRATATIKRYRQLPNTTPSTRRTMVRLPTSVSPMIREASAMVTMPVPTLMSLLF